MMGVPVFVSQLALIFSCQLMSVSAFRATTLLHDSKRMASRSRVKAAEVSYDQEEYETYSRCMSPMEERSSVLSEGNEFSGKSSSWSWLKSFFVKPAYNSGSGTLILLRCGQSTYNANQTFTGWLDPDLTPLGIQECVQASQLLLAEGYETPDVVYTSRLKRAVKSVWTCLEELDALFLPVFKTYRLNQRMYGALQGLSKVESSKQLGQGAVQAWRTNFKARPPPLVRDDPSHPHHDRRYADLDPAVIPESESLLDCQERVRPLWTYKISQDLAVGKTVLVVAHRDALRGLIQNFEQHSDPQGLSLPKGVPLVYKFDHEMRLVDIPKANQGTALFSDSSGFFLGDPKKLKARILEQQVELGLDAIPSQKRVARLVDALSKLRIEADLARGIAGRRVALSGNNTQSFDKWTDDPCEFEDYDVFSVEESESIQPSIITLADKQKKEDRTNDKMDGAVVVLIRHGRTPHNNFGLFTGWQDPPLADGGVDDARNAGRLLKQHSFEFDVVYTSWLTRAIQTAYYVLDELDCTWIPMVKSWRLNERMYGDLTGKSKKMIAHQFGDAQLRKWRRGYTVRPPAISSYSTEYPGNDVRRAKHFQDLPISWRETINRSIEQRRLVLHRKFPKTESLKDCMDRSIPFYTDRILTQAVQSGKRVLICSHENAIRGILKHLCSIPEEAMNQLHLPNGLPLIYNVKSKCITLLDDGSGTDPMSVHDFGPAARYLFKPCELGDDF